MWLPWTTLRGIDRFMSQNLMALAGFLRVAGKTSLDKAAPFLKAIEMLTNDQGPGYAVASPQQVRPVCRDRCPTD